MDRAPKRNLSGGKVAEDTKDKVKTQAPQRSCKRISADTHYWKSHTFSKAKNLLPLLKNSFSPLEVQFNDDKNNSIKNEASTLRNLETLSEVGLFQRSWVCWWKQRKLWSSDMVGHTFVLSKKNQSWILSLVKNGLVGNVPLYNSCIAPRNTSYDTTQLMLILLSAFHSKIKLLKYKYMLRTIDKHKLHFVVKTKHLQQK